MKLAVLADIHANLAALQRVVEDIDAWRPDVVVVGGDVVNRGPQPAECLAFVLERQRTHGWRTVLGNHEEYVIQQAGPNPPGHRRFGGHLPTNPLDAGAAGRRHRAAASDALSAERRRTGWQRSACSPRLDARHARRHLSHDHGRHTARTGRSSRAGRALRRPHPLAAGAPGGRHAGRQRRVGRAALRRRPAGQLRAADLGRRRLAGRD